MASIDPSKTAPGAEASTAVVPKPAAKASKSNGKRARRTDISITDVAARAKVSIGTVSRVFNHHPNVAADLRRRVLSASRTLRFVPKVPHRCIGVVTGRHSPALPVGYVSVMTSLISRHLAARRYAIELIDVENLELAYEAHIEGVIGVVFDDRLRSLKGIPNLPLITINHPLLEAGIHSIRADHHQQAVLATEYLIRQGHRQIALLQIEPDEWGSRERRRGYLETLASAGIEHDPAMVQFTLGQPLYDVVTGLVRRGGATALLNFSEDASLQVLHFLSNILKLRIGKDISTISLEDLPIYQYFTPPQTTVHQPMEDLARLAVEKMLELCDQTRPGRTSATPPVDLCLPSALIERESVARLDVAPVAPTLSPAAP
jgi:LacI family transcriptional regulator